MDYGDSNDENSDAQLLEEERPLAQILAHDHLRRLAGSVARISFFAQENGSVGGVQFLHPGGHLPGVERVNPVVSLGGFEQHGGVVALLDVVVRRVRLNVLEGLAVVGRPVLRSPRRAE
jgi:hypothetical protein